VKVMLEVSQRKEIPNSGDTLKATHTKECMQKLLYGQSNDLDMVKSEMDNERKWVIAELTHVKLEKRNE